MASTASARAPASMPGFLFGLFGLLLAYSARAGPESAPGDRCPDYVARHAPLIWLHSDDPFKPSDLLTHVRHTTPMLDGNPIPDLPSLDLDNLDILNQYGEKNIALTSNDDPLTYPQWLYGEAPDADGRIHNSTPCVVVLVEKNQRDLDAFFFYFYSFNEGPNITQVLEPLKHIVKGEKVESGMHFGDHVGDWEHNMVRFRDGNPTGIYFSQHVDGSSYHWDDSKLSKSDGRPIVYSARGSHANYAAAGNQIHNVVLVDYCDEGQKWDPVLSAYFYRFDAQSFRFTRIDPPDGLASSPSPSANLTSLIYYAGRWGDAQWPDSDPRQDTVPKFGLKRFNAGPTGPRHKHLVRKGLKPDQRRKMGWTEWFVDKMATAFLMGGHDFKPDRDIPDLTGKVIIVTGGNAGLGLETIRQIAKHNPAHIYLAGRSKERGEKAIEALRKEGASIAPISYLPLDLSSFDSIKAAVQSFKESSQRLDLLINNAGIMSTPDGLTQEGYEIQFGTNHMGHALFTQLLLPVMKKTANENPDVRIVFLSSGAEGWAPKDTYQFDKLKTKMPETASRYRYGISKVANIHYAAALAERNPEIKVVSVHPGVVETNLAESIINNSNFLIGMVVYLGTKVAAVSPQKGALNQLWASFSPDVRSGTFYHPVGVTGKGTRFSENKDKREQLYKWTEDELRSHL
ncbi:vacuolar protein sorting-associated protein 62 [Colletotrichum karsti]|uniref:Vacuolar protein sorting-associated protein 62 n=1 Tax=Colletotrichum karsti TaxID=1095194 RepID=A0A9P6LFT3_9PEZI|nr:vacuolar protein sorting-associated protein 62 [Colletotrichum karsti]KAF9871798.1 vacuolar protein sorting-associated protein 62 [Colletotrichum karsti]